MNLKTQMKNKKQPKVKSNKTKQKPNPKPNQTTNKKCRQAKTPNKKCRQTKTPNKQPQNPTTKQRKEKEAQKKKKKAPNIENQMRLLEKLLKGFKITNYFVRLIEYVCLCSSFEMVSLENREVIGEEKIF